MDINDIRLEFLGHSGFLISSEKGKRIAIDPYNLSENIEKADIILITHSHYDHCSIKDIAKLAKPGTTIIIPPDVQSKITKINDVQMQIIEVGDELELSGIKIEAFCAYNVDKDFHPKSEGWLGYLLKLGNVILYHAGDTDRIPEMEKLTGYGKKENTFVMILPVSGTYVMNAEEAAAVASAVNPDIAIPMHYGAGVAGTIDDAKRFVELCKNSGLRAEILEKK